MKHEENCPKIYHRIKAFGTEFMTHESTAAICNKCPDYSLTGCNAYRRNMAERKVLKGR